MIVDPYFYLAATVAVLIVGMAKGGFGGGIAVVGVPLMAMVVSPFQAAAVMLPILMVMDVLAMRAYWGRWDWRNLRILLPAAMLGTLLGFVTARAVQFSPDTGRLAENAVAVALHKRALDGACEVYFWKDARQREVDFVVKEGRQVTQLIQVCWDMTDGDTRQREIRALLQAGEDLSCDRLLVLTADADSEEEVEWFGKRGRIRLLPLWRWFNEQGGT